MTALAWAPHALTEFDGNYYLAGLPSGPILALSDSAAEIVLDIVDGDTVDVVTERVAGLVGLPAAALRADISRTIETLIGHGLLRRCP